LTASGGIGYRPAFMAKLEARAAELAAAWGRRPSRGVAASIRIFYGQRARELPLHARAALCVALGEAAELQGRFESARWLYAAAVAAADPSKDERLYARSAVRALLNASRLGDRSLLTAVAKVVEVLPERKTTARLAGLGATARGLERYLKEDWDAARRAFEAAMGASWESQDAENEALAQHLLAQAWARLGKVARAREHADAGLAAAKRSGSWLLERRLALEALMFRLLANPTPEALGEARSIVREVRSLGFPRLESLAWAKLARGILSDGAHVEAFLAKAEELLPVGHPDRAFVKTLRAAAAKRSGKGADGRLTRELDALAALAKR
jgi:tetratricopeptide (TPR) repeat protein